MPTKSQLISDVILQLTQSAPTDDLAIEESQVASWLSDALNELIVNEVESEMKKGNSIPAVYITRETGLPLTEENVADLDDENQRMYLQLSSEVLDLKNESGIIKVLDYDLNPIFKTASEDLEIYNALRFARATSENPLYYSEDNKIFVKGFTTADLEFNEFMVWYIKRQNLLTMADTDEVKVSDQLRNVLVQTVVEKGKNELYGSQPDENNDGVDRKVPVYHRQLTSQDQSQQPTE